MDTRRHVSIAQLTIIAMLGLLGRHVGWQGNRDSHAKSPQQGQGRRARCDAAVEGLTRHPQMGTVEQPSSDHPVYMGERF
jgi:hypothetical protein